MNRTVSDLQLAMSVHDQLLEVVEPATASTIRSSSLWSNRILLGIATVGLIGFLLLLWESFYPSENDVVLRISGAILGSTLYAFWTARTYLRDSTFSRRYSQDYVVRFGLGVVAGFILGSFAADGGTTDGEEALASALQNFGPFTLSVVGGFSAEAVVQILQRIAEVLVTTVRGSEREAAKTAADKVAHKKINDAASDINNALQSDSPEEMKKLVREIASNLLKKS